jgi:hypothetical protein
VLDPAAEIQAEFSLPNRQFAWLEAADLDGDGQAEICAITLSTEGMEAIGVNLEGEQLWSYPMPSQSHPRYVEAVVAGKLFADQPGQWLLPSADGRIHVLDAEGNPIDVVATGKSVAGVATAEWDGKHVLLVSSAPLPAQGPNAPPAESGSVDAWQVEPAQGP